MVLVPGDIAPGVLDLLERAVTVVAVDHGMRLCGYCVAYISSNNLWLSPLTREPSLFQPSSTEGTTCDSADTWYESKDHPVRIIEVYPHIYSFPRIKLSITQEP